jgi:hypothetical protein
MLFDPLGEQFHLRSGPINIVDRLGRKMEVVRKKHKTFVSLGIVISYRGARDRDSPSGT